MAAPNSLDEAHRTATTLQRIAAVRPFEILSVEPTTWKGNVDTFRHLAECSHRLVELHRNHDASLVPQAWDTITSGYRDFLNGIDDSMLRDLRSTVTGTGAAIEAACSSMKQAVASIQHAATAIGTPIGPESTCTEIARTVEIVRLIEHAPDVTYVDASSPAWGQRWREVDAAVIALNALDELESTWRDRVTDEAWRMDAAEARTIEIASGTSKLRFLKGDWRKLAAQYKVAYKVEPPKEQPRRLELVSAIEEHAKLTAEIESAAPVLRQALPGWHGRSGWTPVHRAAATWLLDLRRQADQNAEAQAALTIICDGRAGAAELRGSEQIQTAVNNMQSHLRAVEGKIPGVALEAGEMTLGLLEQSVNMWAGAVSAITNLDASFATDAPTSVAVLQQVVDAVLERQEIAASIAAAVDPVSAIFRTQPTTDADWCAAVPEIDAAIALATDELRGELTNGALDVLARKPADLEAQADQFYNAASSAHTDITDLLDSIGVQRASVLGGDAIESAELATLTATMKRWYDHREDLDRIRILNQQIADCNELGLAVATDMIGSTAHPEHILPALKRGWVEHLIGRAYAERPQIARFDRDIHSDAVDQFRKGDVLRLRWNRARIARVHYDNMPNLRAPGQMEQLRDQFNRKRGHKPIRRLIADTGPIIQQLKPVFMMSPLSIASFLPGAALDFDLVVFDEASQVEPVEAFGAMLRGSQVVVVGDRRQLPPTNFFSKTFEEEIDDESEEAEALDRVTAAESILTMFEMMGAQGRMLEWHYRSQHESLIHVSNVSCYGGGLLVFPSPCRDRSQRGVSFTHVEDGVYERSGSRTNPIEAEAIARRVIEHAELHPRQTLGVVAFSTAQRDAIIDKIERLRRTASETVEQFFSSHSDEPFFVKNLENVQGDERDVILISIGYGRTADGKLGKSFGPINNVGGERRLNVLISRSKLRCEVFSNFMADELPVTSASPAGVRMLRDFLRYAASGTHAEEIEEEAIESKGQELPTVIGSRLEEHGWKVAYSVGTANCRIDIAVVDPRDPTSYLAGIMLDGPAYAMTQVTRDRDRTTHTVLHNLGWKIINTWAPEWYTRPDTSLERVISELEGIRGGTHHPGAPVVVEPDDEIEREDGEDLSGKADLELPELADYEVHDVTSQSQRYINSWGGVLYDAPMSELAFVVAEIAETEGPVHFEDVVRRLCDASGLKGVKERARKHIKAGMKAAAAEYDFQLTGSITSFNLWLWSTDVEPLPGRSRESLPEAYRKFDRICPQEIMGTIAEYVPYAFGIAQERVYEGVVRMLGFSRASANMQSTVTAAIKHMIKEGMLHEENGSLYVLEQAEADE